MSLHEPHAQTLLGVASPEVEGLCSLTSRLMSPPPGVPKHFPQWVLLFTYPTLKDLGNDLATALTFPKPSPVSYSECMCGVAYSSPEKTENTRTARHVRKTGAALKMTDSIASDSFIQGLFQVSRQGPWWAYFCGFTETKLLWVAKN